MVLSMMRACQTLRRSMTTPAWTARRCLFSTESGEKITSGGFSYPAPRALQQIVKLELLEHESKERIEAIWSEYHSSKDDSLVTTLSADAFKTLTQRASASPFFLFPVYRQEGFFNMICQFQDTCFLLTYLEAFKENPGLAPPCLTVSLYDDLVESKDIGLLRADIVNMLDKKVRACCVVTYMSVRLIDSLSMCMYMATDSRCRSHACCSSSSLRATRTRSSLRGSTSSTTRRSSSTLKPIASRCRALRQRRRRLRSEQCSYCVCATNREPVRTDHRNEALGVLGARGMRLLVARVKQVHVPSKEHGTRAQEEHDRATTTALRELHVVDVLHHAEVCV